MKIQLSQEKHSGFSLLGIMMVVATMGLLAAIAIPCFPKTHTSVRTNGCVANLKQIQGAFKKKALETKVFTRDELTLKSISEKFTDHSVLAINFQMDTQVGEAYSLIYFSSEPTQVIVGHKFSSAL